MTLSDWWMLVSVATLTTIAVVATALGADWFYAGFMFGAVSISVVASLYWRQASKS